ncbi:hypothetical protein RMCBS344292_04624 [Rhizopus microsporus]|nr:hypothetical protein RMCBS344292_04624 [Rhizopus microsporus]
MNNNREEMFNNLALAIISTQNEIKNAIKVVSAQVIEIKDEIMELRTAKELESILTNTADSSSPRRTRHDKLSQCLSLDNLCPDRSVQHPVVESTKNKRQFSWDLFRKLMKDVHGSPVGNVMFNAARDCITIFRLPALICEVNHKHQTENGKSFKDTDPQAKLAVIGALEEMTPPFIPLRACLGSWSANLMIHYYWARNEKNRYFAASSNE